nr:hypothetical protein CFP56_69962 [Quercus suber]
MNEDFCNAKTIKDSEIVLRFWEHTLKQCKRRKARDDDGKGCVFRKFFIDALQFEMYETITGYVTSDFLESELSEVSAMECSRIINRWKERANRAITWKKKKCMRRKAGDDDGSGREDVAMADVSGADLAGEDVAGADVVMEDVVVVDVSRTNVSGADLARADVAVEDVAMKDVAGLIWQGGCIFMKFFIDALGF